MKNGKPENCPACDGIGEMKILGLTVRCSTCYGLGFVFVTKAKKKTSKYSQKIAKK
jgi:DnaJ-class molecular chaperone